MYMRITLVILFLSCALFAGRFAAAQGNKAATPFQYKATQATLKLSTAEYTDRVQAIWLSQMAAAIMGFQFEHRTASVEWVDKLPRAYEAAPVDDDWYYEMAAIRAFEKYGVNMTVQQLGEQWKENNCGSWGSSEQTRLLLGKGISAPETGHARYNKLWFSIGPQFSADVYGALAPGLPNLAGKLARDYGHVNGYAEGVDGAVFMAAMVSIGFVEKDPKTIVRKATKLISPLSPYRQCLDLVISMAEKGKTAREIFDAVEDRWHIEYPATNNAVPNGGIVAASVWFGEGDFLKTVNLAFGAADFTDADCNAANAAAVIAAMKGMKALPENVVKPFNDRIKGSEMGGVKLTPPVDESISELSKRTVAVGQKIMARHGVKNSNDMLTISVQEPVTQSPELFTLADYTKFWNPDWKLERAGFGGAGGGMRGIHGNTYLDGEVLATYPRDEVRGLKLERTIEIQDQKTLSFDAGVDSARAWDLSVFVDNKSVLNKQMLGTAEPRKWEPVSVDLTPYRGKKITIRIYQRVLVRGREAGNAYWRNLQIK
jgi:hypothetical protein